MSVQGLNLVVGNAIVDREFRERLLGCPDQREELLEPFDLSAEERALVLECREQTLEGFAAVLDDWVARQAATPQGGTPHAPPAPSYEESRANS